MGRAESVVDVGIFAAREFVREIAIVLFFLGMETQVLEQQRVARFQVRHEAARYFADTVGCERDLPSQRRAEIFGDRLETQFRGTLLGPAQMRAENRDRTVSRDV